MGRRAALLLAGLAWPAPLARKLELLGLLVATADNSLIRSLAHARARAPSPRRDAAYLPACLSVTAPVQRRLAIQLPSPYLAPSLPPHLPFSERTRKPNPNSTAPHAPHVPHYHAHQTLITHPYPQNKER
ncbi:uncharacterized protein K452DRAFT_313793 [Aplosporella prunicola CBS 121167]|uniref:Secreted protein n=1 Tax=Aplosporella prunicola CBS 121167 TaxID=1176127 RepID=A0A6A6AY33_9PEZI|nr:uncharacterized protein K452DRAFT_313793 [Aplosporella prunicola CBS 121167]KAF2135677.1 hypothetical protein K452DRAFT_313793 [Aplosporella prunicola CBS 121167]